MLKKYNKSIFPTASAILYSEVVFLDKKDKKKRVIDLRRFFEPELQSLDENGSYTGVTRETFAGNPDDEPVQDADDL